MTAPIIPADQWPEWADRHCWDKNGDGWFYGLVTTSALKWLPELRRSNIPMPVGHDWHVPVMRNQPASAIDLEQFREAVCAYRLASLAGLTDCEAHGVKGHSFGESIEHADRLLALIDAQANVRSSSEHSEPALQRPLIARQLAEWHEDDGPAMWWAWCGSDWAGEPAWCGTPNDSDWPGYHTHWTPHPAWPMQPSKGEGE